ncbi:MAG TPA: alpha/beta fold hydrolase [Allosphingosinicella sp.]|nr:alpha/beta fold hydrolase [Allosphingosinicella sp.]
MFRLLASIALLAGGTASAQQPAPPPPPEPAPSANTAPPATDTAGLYGLRENVEHLDISPDGSRVVFLQPGPGRETIAYVYDLAGGGAVRQIARSDGSPERLRRCNFAANDRLICRVVAMDASAGFLIPFSRLISVDLNGGSPVLLGEQRSLDDARIRQNDGAIIDWLGGAEGVVLMAREYVPEAGRVGSRVNRTADGLAVDRIDVRTGRSTRIEAPNRRAGAYISDGRGTVRIMSTPTIRGSTGLAGSRIEHFYRLRSGGDWRPLGNHDELTGDGTIPLAVDARLDAAYVLRKLNGRFALYRVKLDESLASELVYANEQVDVDNVVFANRGARVIGVTFADDRRRIVYFDSDYAAIARMLGRAIPNLPLIDFGSTSGDGNKVIVHAGSDTDAGRYYVYDRTARSLNELLPVRPPLENRPAATVTAVTYPAADGTQIPAYLTLPPGRTDARGLPAVIYPHGGPSARDEWGFDPITQFLASQGYAVLQPNYRGSAGYGDAWLSRNGFQSWRVSIGDITAGARWLASARGADASRMAIVGWSYGGYAALQSAVVEPGLFRAVAAIAPVTDLQQAKEDFRHYTSRRNITEYIGSGPHVAEGSPARHAAAITAPVLLFHGDRDLNVNVVHSRQMDSALRGAGKRSELVVFQGLEHDLADSAVRVQMLRRIGTFLQTNLAPRQ